MSLRIFSFFEKRIYGSGKKSYFFRLILSILMALPVIVLLIMISVSSYRDITEDIYHDSLTKIQLVSTIVHERINGVVNTTISLASRPKLVENMLYENWKEALKYVENVPNEFEYIDTVFITDGKGILKTGTVGFEKIEDNDFSYRDWYKGVSKNWEPYVSEFYKRANEPQLNVISIAVPIKLLPVEGVDQDGKGKAGNPATGKEDGILGILVVQLKHEIFSKWLSDIDLGKDSYVFITDKNGMLITHPGYDTSEELIDWSDKAIISEALPGSSDVEVSKDENNNEVLAAYSACEDHGWVIVMMQPAKTALASRTRSLFITIPTYIILFALIVTVINLLLNYIKNIRKASEISNRLALIVEQSEDAIYSRDLNDVITSWNRGAEKIFGYRADEVIGRLFKDFIPNDVDDGYDKLKQEILANKGISGHITERIRKDGKRIYISFSAVILKDLKGINTGYSIIARDVTKQINDEKILQEKTKNLEELNRELETFSYSVSHDLRAPLRAIQGYGDIIIEDYGDNLEPDISKYIEKMHKASEKMGIIIDNLLILSRTTRDLADYKKIDFTQLSERTGRELISLKENEGRKIEFKVMENMYVMGDERLIGIAMSNLLSNALKFTMKNNKNAVIKVGIKTIKGEKVIFISDNGIGFDMKYSGKLFQPFQRLHSDSDFAGNGIGLTIVKRIIDRHNGRIWVKSRKLIGTTFYIMLPGIDIGR